ncbi:heavy metal sensor histidine kinase [Aeromonas intestinalis]
MRDNASIILRTMLLVSVAITLSMMALLFLVERSLKNHFMELDEDIVSNKASIILSLSKQKDALSKIMAWDAANSDEGFYIKLLDDERLVYKSSRSRLSPGNNAGTFMSISETEPPSSHNYIVKTIHVDIDKQRYSVMIYLDASVHSHFLADFRVQLLIIFCGAWLIIILSTYLGIKKGHKPIYSLSKHMSTIQAEKLEATLAIDKYPGELRELVESFNGMLTKLNGSFSKLSDFSNDVAHELRTPLTNIIMQAQVGLSQERSIPEYQELMYSILEELEQLAKMVGDMLWLARTDNGLISADKEPLSLTSELSSLLDFFTYLAEEKSLTFELINNEDHVMADKIMFRRAISNVISNAIRYSDHGSPIGISLSRGSSHGTLVSVTNKCTGISGEPISRMFDRLYRGDISRSGSSDGVGLGLSIVKSIIEVHGGKVWNEVDGEHITFHLLFPAR